MNVKSFFSDALGFGLASFLTKGVAFVVVPILTRELSPGEYGSLELLLGLSGFIAVLISMSLESYLARVWGGLDGLAKKAKVFSVLFITTWLLGSAVIFAVWPFSQSVASSLFDSAFHSDAIFWVCFSAYLTSLSGLPLMALRMDRRIRPFLLVTVSQSASYLVFIFWFFFSESISVLFVVLSTVLSTAVSLCLALYFVSCYLKPVFDFATLKPALRFGLPLLPAVAATLVNSQVDKYALLYFFDTRIVGEFAVITKIAAVVTMAVMVFRQAWLPYSYSLARRKDHGENQFKRVLTAYYIVGLIGCFVLVYFIDPILGFLAPSEYRVQHEILPVLLLAAIVYGSASIVNVGTMVSGKTEWNSYASLLGVSLNVVLTLSLVPLFGVAGAAWGTLVASFAFMWLLSWRSSKLVAIKFQQKIVLLLSVIYLLCSFAVL